MSPRSDSCALLTTRSWAAGSRSELFVLDAADFYELESVVLSEREDDALNLRARVARREFPDLSRVGLAAKVSGDSQGTRSWAAGSRSELFVLDAADFYELESVVLSEREDDALNLRARVARREFPDLSRVGLAAKVSGDSQGHLGFTLATPLEAPGS